MKEESLTIMRSEEMLVLKKDMFELASRQKDDKNRIETRLDALLRRVEEVSDLHVELNDSVNRRMSYAFLLCGFAISFAIVTLLVR